MTNAALPVGVIGCGRMGRLHTRVYSQMPTVRLVGVHDSNFAAAQAAAKEYNCTAFEKLEDLLAQVKAVTIATPTQYHVASAEPCLNRKIACMIEKPLARDVAEAQRIVDCAARNQTLVQVGHVERFNPAVRALNQLNTKPEFIEVTRVSPMTFRSIDVGVVLDVMIHDIDIVLRLANAPLERIDAAGVSVIGQVEDICNARLAFANGCVANLTASRLALKTERRLRVFSRDVYVSLDYQKRQGIVVRRGKNLEDIRAAVQKVRSGEVQDLAQLNYANLVQIEPLPIDDVEPLRAEQDAFVEAVANGTRPPISAEDGLAAVRVAYQIMQAIGAKTL